MSLIKLKKQLVANDITTGVIPDPPAGFKWNHYRPLSDFQEYIDIMRKNGHNPIAVSQLYCEETFVFETIHEADQVLLVFDYNKSPTECSFGWWYGKDDFMDTVNKYEQESKDYKVLIHWL